VNGGRINASAGGWFDSKISLTDQNGTVGWPVHTCGRITCGRITCGRDRRSRSRLCSGCTVYRNGAHGCAMRLVKVCTKLGKSRPASLIPPTQEHRRETRLPQDAAPTGRL
jgi:hypothetical protein